MENENTIVKRSDKIKSWLDSKPGKYDIFIVILLYIAGVAALYFIGNFPIRIAAYGDELLYYTIAQSIHDGNGIMCLNAHTNFDKVAYSFILSPFFGIEDPVLRVKMITLFNKALIMTSIFFVYLIGKEIELNRGSMLMTLAVTLVWSDFSYSLTFMSENLNWPLIMLAIYLWLKSKKSKHYVWYALVLGAVCYIGYLCKNIFLAMLLSAVLFEIAYPFIEFLMNRRNDPPKKLRECFDTRGLIGCGITIVLFAVCYISGNALLFGGSASNAAGAVTGVLDIFMNNYIFLYLIFAFVYYLAAAIIAVLVMPVAYSAVNIKDMDTTTRKLFSFLMIYLLISCAMVAYLISIKEDLGLIFPRIHMRYFGFILLLLIAVFFKVLQTKSGTGSVSSRTQLIFTMAAAFFTCMIFYGFDDLSAVDQSVLNVYNSAAEVIQNYTAAGGERKFYLIKLASFVIFAVIIFLVYYYKNKKNSERAAACVFSIFMLMVCVQNYRLEAAQIKGRYSTDNEMISNVLDINHYLDNADDDKNILCICSNKYGNKQKTFTTYFDHMNDLCVCSERDLTKYTSDGKTIDIPNTEFEINISNFPFTYDKFSGFDYIITDNDCYTKLRGVTQIDEASGEFYTLYKNDTPAAVEIVPVEYVGEPLEITFATDKNNSEKYCDSGVEKTDEGFYWLSEDRVSFKIPVRGEYDSAEICVDVVKTYRNSHQRYVIVQGDRVLSEGDLNGAGELVFTVPVKFDELAFDIVCPTAFNIKKEAEIILNGKASSYSLGISKITVR